jgi:transcriptional regulator GlxA family with amidase domain
MDPKIEMIIKLMHDNLRRDLRLEQLARSLNRSSSRLRHMFKSGTGTTPTRYLHSLRMQQAKKLLETTFLSVKEIMVRVGIHDESHFVRDFKHAWGSTPGQYQRTYSRPLVADNQSSSPDSHFGQ